MPALFTNLQSYWSLSGLTDERPAANTLTNNGGVTFVAGKVGNAASFDSSLSENLSHASNASLQSGDIDLTVTAWANLGTLGANRNVVGKWGTLNFEWILYYDPISTAFQIAVSGDGTTVTTLTATTFGTPSTGTWYFLAFRHNATTNEIKITVNTTTDTASYSAGLFVGTAAFILGADDRGLGFFNGLVDEVGFWKNRVLTDAELAQLYNNAGGLAYPSMASLDGFPAGFSIPRYRFEPVPLTIPC